MQGIGVDDPGGFFQLCGSMMMLFSHFRLNDVKVSEIINVVMRQISAIK